MKREDVLFTHDAVRVCCLFFHVPFPPFFFVALTFSRTAHALPANKLQSRPLFLQ